MKSYLFDWRSLSPEKLYEANSNKDESWHVASIPAVIGDEYCMIDISHKNSDDGTCFRLEFYKTNENWKHLEWRGDGYESCLFGWNEEIKTTKSYKMFCRRVEDIAIWFFLNK